MSPEVILLILRIVGAIILLAFFAALGWFIYKDIQVATRYTTLLQTPPGSLILVENVTGVIENGQRFKLLPITTIGRDDGNTISLDDDYASIEHATLSFQDHHWWLVDLESRNGTMLNDSPVISATIIRDGDIITVGQTQLRALL